MAQIPPAEPVDQTSNQHSAPLAGGSNDRNLEATLSSVRTAVGRVATDGNRSAAELTLSTAVTPMMIRFADIEKTSSLHNSRCHGPRLMLVTLPSRIGDINRYKYMWALIALSNSLRLRNFQYAPPNPGMMW
jgi:hypothetical protein